MKLSILYRGPLSSCNYGCSYCPFAKHHETAKELAIDRAALERFVEWVEDRRDDAISVFFTPWGEALIRGWYQAAIARLSHLPNIQKVAIQTNLSCHLGWAASCDAKRVGLWTTFHPSETTRQRFLRQCGELDRWQIRYSVGVVGTKENRPEIEALRSELRPEIYLWINAYKGRADYYDAETLARFAEIDPLFPINNCNHPSFGKSCRTGNSVISVDGQGTIRRCHFDGEPLGNIYEPGFERVLRERPCTNQTCGCHIGYVHLDELKLYDAFGAGVLERIPSFGVTAPPRPGRQENPPSLRK